MVGNLSTACEKEPEKVLQQADNPKVLSGEEYEIVESDLQVADTTLFAAIASVKFQASIIPETGGPSPSYTPPSLGYLTPEEFIFYVEATLNFDWYNLEVSQTNFEHYVEIVQVPVDVSGVTATIEESDLIDTYADFHSFVLGHLPEGKQVLICNVWISELNLNEEYATVKLKVTYSEDNIVVITPVGATDDWWAIDQVGKCNFTMPGKDAAWRLQQLVNWYAHGWSGNSSTSTGGIAPVCIYANGTWVNTAGLNFGQNIPGYWPLAVCDNICLDETDMEAELVSYFNATDNVLPSYATRKYTEYESKTSTGGNEEGCWASWYPWGNHLVGFEWGQHVCTSNGLPW